MTTERTERNCTHCTHCTHCTTLNTVKHQFTVSPLRIPLSSQTPSARRGWASKARAGATYTDHEQHKGLQVRVPLISRGYEQVVECDPLSEVHFK
jgi:hypothetical protein